MSQKRTWAWSQYLKEILNKKLLELVVEDSRSRHELFN